jgi:hypothetical protein
MPVSLPPMPDRMKILKMAQKDGPDAVDELMA